MTDPKRADLEALERYAESLRGRGGFQSHYALPDIRAAIEEIERLRAEVERLRDRVLDVVQTQVVNEDGEYLVIRLVLSKLEASRVNMATEDWIVAKIKGGLGVLEL